MELLTLDFLELLEHDVGCRSFCFFILARFTRIMPNCRYVIVFEICQHKFCEFCGQVKKYRRSQQKRRKKSSAVKWCQVQFPLIYHSSAIWWTNGCHRDGIMEFLTCHHDMGISNCRCKMWGSRSDENPWRTRDPLVYFSILAHSWQILNFCTGRIIDSTFVASQDLFD